MSGRTVLGIGLLIGAAVIGGCATCPETYSKAPPAVNLRLAALFTDNMVLQRDMRTPVWGWAEPGGRVTVEIGKQRVSGLADADGKWMVRLRPMKAGGPYEMKIAGAETITLHNVMVGEVWVCSGQSNMQWPVKMDTWGVRNRDEEVANANYPNIRLFIVPMKRSFSPLENLEGEEVTPWAVCSPETVGPFSAVAYFFGREIHTHLGVPVGLIESAWGGTFAEAWTSQESLRTLPDFVTWIEDVQAKAKEQLPRIEDLRREFEEQERAWVASLDASDAGYQAGQPAWSAQNLRETGWSPVAVPGAWEKAGYPDLDGILWLRKTVEIPASWTGKDLTLSLGPVNDAERTWFNGVMVGQTDLKGNWRISREYTIPAELVKKGRGVITVRVVDVGGQGGLLGTAEQVSLSCPSDAQTPSIPLAGEWMSKIGLNLKNVPAPPEEPLVLSNNPNLPCVLFDGMISPLLPYGIRGAIWYQGESNAGRAYQYRTLFPTLITDWRKHWGQGDFPFLFVQLANFMAVKPEPDDDPWAELREAQCMTLSLPNTGMAVTIDIGEADDIHPRNKQDVGRRLALAARHVAYGETLDYSGPMYRSMTIEGSTIRLYFDHVDGGLTTRDNKPLQGFAIAGEDRKFVWADARIDGDTVVVFSDSVPNPAAVRYAWAINPVCNLYNRAGLPASPFRTDSWPGVTADKK